jgi:transposase-like protein
MRMATIVTLSTLEQLSLDRIASNTPGKKRNALRAQIVQLASERKSNKAIARALGITERTAARWRQRFLVSGTTGVEKERLRPGRPAAIPDRQIQKVLAKFGDKQLSTRVIARIVGVSATSVRRIWKSHGMTRR